MAHTYVNFKQYDINIWGEDHITRVVISSNENPNEYISVGDTEQVINSSDEFMFIYASVLMSGVMKDEQRLLKHVQRCYDVHCEEL